MRWSDSLADGLAGHLDGAGVGRGGVVPGADVVAHLAVGGEAVTLLNPLRFQWAFQ